MDFHNDPTCTLTTPCSRIDIYPSLGDGENRCAMNLFQRFFRAKKDIGNVRLGDIDGINNQKRLGMIASHHRDSDVGTRAVEKLRDQRALTQVALNARDQRVSEQAVARITNETLLAKIAKQNSGYFHVRHTALQKITDRGLLTKISMIKEEDEYQCRSIRLKAAVQLGNKRLAAQLLKGNGALFADMRVVKLLLDDEEALARIARDLKQINPSRLGLLRFRISARLRIAYQGRVRLAALRKVNTPALLVDIAANAQDEDMRKKAVQRLRNNQELLAQVAKNAKTFSVESVDLLEDQVVRLQVKRQF